jgi:hypothetical protein
VLENAVEHTTPAGTKRELSAITGNRMAKRFTKKKKKR